MKKIACLVVLALGFGCCWAAAQQPTTTAASSTNAAYVQGVAPGYRPTAGSGLNLNLAAGTAFCGNTIRNFGGTQLTLKASATNYVYLNPASNCVPAANTTGFTATIIPIATVVTSASAITTVTDVRTWFVAPSSGGGTASPSASTTTQGTVALAQDLGGTAARPNVTGLQGKPVSSTAPASGQGLVWNGSAWAPAAVGNGNVPPTSSATTGKRISNNGTNPAWSAPELDCSQFSGADMSLKLRACLAALNSISTQGGIADARSFAGNQTWSVNPLAGAEPSSGRILLGPGQISTYVPVVIPSFWSIQGMQERGYTTQSGTSIQAAAGHFQTTYTTGTVSISGTAVTGTGTAWTSAMVGCGFVSPAGGTNSGNNNDSYGIISAVGSATSLTLASVITNGTGSTANSYDIYCPVVSMGDGIQGPNGDFGINLDWLDIDCNGLAGCVGVMNWYAQEHSGLDHVEIHGFTNIGLDREGPGAQNSGPYQNLTISTYTSCNPAAIPIVTRGYISPNRGIQYAGIFGNGTCTPAVGIDVENSQERIQNIHFEQVATAVEINAAVNCPVACVDTHHTVGAGLVSNFTGGGLGGTTLVDIATGNGTPSNIVLLAGSQAAYKNVMVDHQNSCTNTDSSFGMYVLNRSGAKALSTGPC